MDLWIKIDTLLRTPCEEPKPFGGFHVLMLTLVVLGCVLVVFLHKREHPEHVRHFILITGICVILFEIYKQYVLNFSVVDGKLVFHICWNAFPFQFCYLPLYLDILFGVTKKGRLHESLAVLLGTFFIVAGAAVMLFPATVFSEVAGINLQTMLCHGIMIVNGVYLLSSEYVPLKHKSILKALPVFAVCVVIATVFNEIAYYTGITEITEFNMFYISRHYGSIDLPIAVNLPFEISPPVIFFGYLFGFPLLAYLVLLIAMGIKKGALAIKSEFAYRVEAQNNTEKNLR